MDVQPYLNTSCRLFIKSLPAQFSPEDTMDFLRTFGAIHVEPMSPFGKMKHTAFANFINRNEAKLAMNRLHQLEVLGARLIVLWATTKIEKESKSSTFNSLRIPTEDIPPHTPITHPTTSSKEIAHISQCLSANNDFYIQVLRLMERMQLPLQPESIPTSVMIETPDHLHSGEDSDESLVPLRAKYSPVKHAPLSITGLLTKSSELVIPAESDLSVKRRRIEFNLPESGFKKTVPSLYSTFDTPLPIGTLSKPDTPPQLIDPPPPVPSLRLESYIPDYELRHGRMSASEMRRHSLYKAYSRGDIASRLYIKNLSKRVTERDLSYIFGRYVDFDNNNDRISYLVTLMQSGRMRGQAFVCLPSPDIALRALEDTNGFLLHGRPMVVTFARSAMARN